MARLGKDELIARVSAYIGDRDDDESLSVLEDVTDSFTDYEDGAYVTKEFHEEELTRVDSEWRRKYRERFNGGSKETPEISQEQEAERAYQNDDYSSITYDDVFEEDD